MAVAAANPRLSRRGDELRPGEPTGCAGWALPRQAVVWRGASWLSSCPCAQPIPSPLLPEQGRGGRGRAQGRGLLPWLWLLGWVEGLCPSPPRPGEDRSDPGEAPRPHAVVAAGKAAGAAAVGSRSSSSQGVLCWSQRLAQEPEPHQLLRHLPQSHFPHALKKNSPSVGAGFAQKQPEEATPPNGAGLGSPRAPFPLPLERREGRPRP